MTNETLPRNTTSGSVSMCASALQKIQADGSALPAAVTYDSLQGVQSRCISHANTPCGTALDYPASAEGWSIVVAATPERGDHACDVTPDGGCRRSGRRYRTPPRAHPGRDACCAAD